MNQKIKIIHLISSLTRGGRERQLANILANTDQKEYPTKVVFFNKRQNSYFEEYDLENFAIQLKSKGKFARLKELHNLLKSEKPDLVYTWGNGESAGILFLKPFHKFKFINGSIRHGIRSKKISHYFRSLILHLSPHIVSNSYAGLKANNLKRGRVLYNGIDPKFIGSPPLSKKRENKTRHTGFEPEVPLLISVANLVPYKDYFSILKALKKLKEKGHLFRYIILGDGPLRKEIEQTINEYGLFENTQLPGNMENVHEYLQAADIFIHSSKGEGCSNAILEAMAAGLPVIASDTGGTSEIVSEKNGFLFQYKNVSEITHLITKCLSDQALCQKMGSESLILVKNKFTVKEMMNNYYSIIDEII